MPGQWKRRRRRRRRKKRKRRLPNIELDARVGLLDDP
tara:strand:+ start:154 stop:264 length:111 start_codon:yes stop_codon:yes gene_type:complete